MANILMISGSPTKVSRTSALATYLKPIIENHGHFVNKLQIRDLPPEALIYAQFKNPEIINALTLVEQADALIVLSPVYKASYTGVLKSFFDLIPEKGLFGKKVLPIATGGSIAHLLSVEYAFKPLFSILGAKEFIESVYIVDSQLSYTKDDVNFTDSETEKRLLKSITKLLNSLEEKTNSI
ncbi:NADPH-dependent FMN reductase [Niallia sp. Krafla_26]|uniref:NADPH-dependent FMN reductase n=1 Tax=Niallia sp. Krafla_26 TaxID=3064703 RepID=UPI003D166FEC